MKLYVIYIMLWAFGKSGDVRKALFASLVVSSSSAQQHKEHEQSAKIPKKEGTSISEVLSLVCS
jgi:hypothetical protein